MTVRPEPGEDRALLLTRVFAAPRELVFQAWAEPRHLAHWWGPHNFTLPVCEQDFRAGGAYRFCMRAPDGTDHWVWGEYREIVAPERLVFTWAREDEAGLRTGLKNLVTVTFAAQGKKTHLTLHHAAFQTVADRDDHRGGWTECLERLVAHISPRLEFPSNSPTHMNTDTPTTISKAALWTGRIMSLLPVLMLLMSGVMKVAQTAEVVKGFVDWPAGSAVAIGILELVCTAIYLVPRTAVLGAILLAAYFGGATAVSVHMGVNFILPVVFGVFIWGGLWLRDLRLRALLPFVR